MRERRISEQQVERTLANADSLVLGSQGNMVASRATAAGNTLCVVYEDRPVGPDGPYTHVVSVWRK